MNRVGAGRDRSVVMGAAVAASVAVSVVGNGKGDGGRVEAAAVVAASDVGEADNVVSSCFRQVAKKPNAKYIINKNQLFFHLPISSYDM